MIRLHLLRLRPSKILLYIIKVIRYMNLLTSLRANALFTLTCSLACFLAGGMIIRHTGIPTQIWITGLGLMLLSYAPMLLFAASRPYDWLVRIIILLDWGFVVIATIWLVCSLERADIVGIVLETVSIALVAVFAILQQRGLARQIRERIA